MNSEITLESDQLVVTVDRSFPRVIKYEWKETGAVLHGQDMPIKELVINGVLQTPEVNCTVADKRISYALKCPEGKCDIELYLEVAGNVLRFRVSAIREHRWFPVQTIEIPHHSLISVQSSQGGAMLSRVRGSALVDTTEEFVRIESGPCDLNPQTVMYAIVNTGELAATIHNNVIHDYARLACQISRSDAGQRAAVWNGTWIYREVESEAVALPAADILVTGDRNGDGIVDWQDAAIAYRDVMFRPRGADSIRTWAVSQIAMNFASLAQNPFLRVLDHVKKIYLHTDGLGQIIQFKGYQSEGHDSAHPDYGGNVNRRAGGRDQLRFAVKRMEDFNCDAGIHMNATEAYPEAKAYRDQLVYDVDNWRWLDQSKSIDKRRDAVSGELARRIDELAADLPDLKWVYVDVYFGYAWDAWKLATELNTHGWPMFTEFPHVAERYAVWTHTSQEYPDWGIKSKVVRFIHNHEKDIWPRAAEPMLRGSRNLGFMGWHSERDYYAFIENTFTNNLPTKFIQHFPILKWEDTKIECEGNVVVTRNTDGVVSISQDGTPVAIGDNLFMPWDPISAEKIYHWNPVGGTSSWALPESWAGINTVALYRLTDLGREFVATVPVVDGYVRLTVDKSTPYVIYHRTPASLPVIDWGEGSGVNDPGFDSHGFDFWTRFSSDDSLAHIRIENDKQGQTALCVRGRIDGGVRQTLELEPGKTYAASVWVEVDGTRPATLSVRLADGAEFRNSISRSPAINYSDNQSKYLTRYQRMKVTFTMPDEAREATLSLYAGGGAEGSQVHFDDVRLVETVPVDNKGHWFYEDFEHCDEGWGPFVYGYKGDVRTHLSERNGSYTDDVIHGNWSLKTTDEKPNPDPAGGRPMDTVTDSERDPDDDGKTGVVIRTLPQTLLFEPRTSYRMAFDYCVEKDGQYEVAVRADEGDVELLREALVGAGHFTACFETGCVEDCFIAILKTDNERGSLVLDDLAIDRMGGKG